MTAAPGEERALGGGSVYRARGCQPGHEAATPNYGIHSIPTSLLFRGGGQVARQSGVLPADPLVDWARRQVGGEAK